MLTLRIIREPSQIKEFNGLPVVRTPKELSRKGLTNHTIISHPCGLKLSRCPNGYIILCSEEGCGNIGSKEGIKCVKHVETHRHCRYVGCEKRAHFGIESKKALYCSSHKEPNMIDVIHNLCLAPDCGLLAYFGVQDRPAQYCSQHKAPEMIDVLHKRCMAPGCAKGRSFGIPGGPIQYCSEHKLEGMINLYRKRCLAPGCIIIPSFGFKGETRKFCAAHKLEGMVIISAKRCLASSCIISPSFGVPGGISEYCKQHKLPNMVNLRNKLCAYPGCQIHAIFGHEGNIRQYCNRHKQLGMINLISKKCSFTGCKVQARFGLPGGLAQYCSEHKSLGMVNLKDKRCIIDDCDSRPTYGLLFGTGRSHCKKHATLNYYMDQKRKPVCTELKYHNPALFIAPNDVTIYPIRCQDHKLPTDIELIKRACPNCEEVIYYPVNQEYCMECGKYREILICSAREMAVQQLLTAYGIDFVLNKRISLTASRHRPDFLITSNFGYIIVEVDEDQHNRHLQHKEEARMRTIYHDVQYVAPGKQVLFLRYNPDKYDGIPMTDDKVRLEYLLHVVMNMRQLFSLNTSLGYVKLFYDGFNGNPIFQPLTTTNLGDDSDEEW